MSDPSDTPIQGPWPAGAEEVPDVALPDADPSAPAAPSDEGAGVDSGLVESDLAQLSEIDVVAAERDDYLDALRRLQADFENFKKRTIKQQTDLLERAAKGLVEKLLPVLDAADAAVAHGAGEDVAQITGLLTDALVKEGLEPIDPKPGETFDPTVHEAVHHEPADDDAGPTVSDVLRAGYRWRGALLRPAMVKVRG